MQDSHHQLTTYTRRKLFRCLSTLLILFFTNSMHAQTTLDSLVTTWQEPLPTLCITTIDSEEPTCDFVFPPEGAIGIGTTNRTKVPGRAVLMLGDSIIYDSGAYEEDASGMTIRIRGNTSAYYSDKKPYKIKLEKKADMLGRGNARYNDKNWVLLDEGNDHLRTMVGLWMNEQLGLGGWTPTYRFVNVYMNDDYRGIYMLMESVKRNADCRLNVDKTTGYIIERDAYWWNEDLYFASQSGVEYTFKYPDSDDVTTVQKDYIRNCIDTMEVVIADGRYPDYIDVESFARWLLAHDLLGTRDAGGANIYLTKYDDTDETRITMSTLWDFGSILGVDSTWSAIHNSSFFYFPQLLGSPNPLFTSTYCKLFNRYAETLVADLISMVTAFAQSPLAADIALWRPVDGGRWNYPPDTIEQNVEEITNYLTARLQQLQTMLPEDVAIRQPQLEHPSSSATYDLQGRRLNANSKLKSGIYIRNGKKVKQVVLLE